MTTTGYHESVRQGVIVFDGDDTLWETEPLYDAARDHAAQVVAILGLDPERFSEIQKQIDIENIAAFGLSQKRFPFSSVKALEILAEDEGVEVGESEKMAVYEASASVFSSESPLVPSARAVLQEVVKTHEIALLTKGDEDVQMRRLNQSGLEEFFTLVSIVKEKDEAAFTEVLEKMEASAAESWSVGNSLKSDIIPACNIGMRTIWIDSHVWEHERPPDIKVEDIPEMLQASELNQVPDLISVDEITSNQSV